MNNIDWNKAPVGATHAVLYPCFRWFKMNKGIVWSMFLNGDHWEDYGNRLPDVVIEKPTDLNQLIITPVTESVTAASILRAGLNHMEDRAATYDAEQGERSMGKTVTMFNTLYGFELTEEQGWAFMELLKLVRSSQGAYRQDNYEDGAAYMGLMGEAAARERGHD